MDAPQSDVEVAPVVERLRRLDPRFDIRWEPRAVMVRRGSYDAQGKLTASTYDGRWEVVLRGAQDKTANWRDWVRMCFVTPIVDVAPGVAGMEQEGPYAPITDQVAAFFEQVDYLNRQGLAALHAKIDTANERVEQQRLDAFADVDQSALSKAFFTGTMEGGVSQFHPVNISLVGT